MHVGVDMLDPPEMLTVSSDTGSSHQDRRSERYERYEQESLNVQSGTGGPTVPHVCKR
jgi:hypothetical protein